MPGFEDMSHHRSHALNVAVVKRTPEKKNGIPTHDLCMALQSAYSKTTFLWNDPDQGQ